MEQRIEINRTEEKVVDMSAVWILIDLFFNNQIEQAFKEKGKHDQREKTADVHLRGEKSFFQKQMLERLPCGAGRQYGKHAMRDSEQNNKPAGQRTFNNHKLHHTKNNTGEK